MSAVLALEIEVPHAPVAATAHVRLGPLPLVAWPDARPVWDDLTPEEQIAELRRGVESEFFSDFADDPKAWWDCPDDGKVTVDATGVCDACGRVVVS